mmetsp:Transcript_49784/g.128089  ORF Transcript_49784/g.128089 Transcript_49784/m.128089 type:complete len:204 (-) Transcript_49784:938-1549(-)
MCGYTLVPFFTVTPFSASFLITPFSPCSHPHTCVRLAVCRTLFYTAVFPLLSIQACNDCPLHCSHARIPTFVAHMHYCAFLRFHPPLTPLTFSTPHHLVPLFSFALSSPPLSSLPFSAVTTAPFPLLRTLFDCIHRLHQCHLRLGAPHILHLLIILQREAVIPLYRTPALSLPAHQHRYCLLFVIVALQQHLRDYFSRYHPLG